MFLQPSDRLEFGVADDQRGLVPRLGKPAHDFFHIAGVERDEPLDPRQDGAERVGRGRQQLDGIPGDVFRDDFAAPIEDAAAGRRDGDGPETIGFGLELELFVLENLGSEEGAGQNEKRGDENPLRRLGSFPHAIRIEPVHESSLMENHCREASRTRRANAAVASASSGL